jgi:hypothetical protein
VGTLDSRELGKVLMDAGILPPKCRKAVIVLELDQPVKVYTECFGDERCLCVDFKVLRDALLNPDEDPLGPPTVVEG